jgi:hypothetical protein
MSASFEVEPGIVWNLARLTTHIDGKQPAREKCPAFLDMAC